MYGCTKDFRLVVQNRDACTHISGGFELKMLRMHGFSRDFWTTNLYTYVLTDIDRGEIKLLTCTSN